MSLHSITPSGARRVGVPHSQTQNSSAPAVFMAPAVFISVQSNSRSCAGMDLSIYASDVEFRDPITKYDDIEVRKPHCSSFLVEHSAVPHHAAQHAEQGLTRMKCVQGFKQNLSFLKNIFDPTYEMLGIRQISERAVEARWTMNFDVLPVTRSPLGKFWQPKLEFTGGNPIFPA